jgi:hypothetical protein
MDVVIRAALTYPADYPNHPCPSSGFRDRQGGQAREGHAPGIPGLPDLIVGLEPGGSVGAFARYPGDVHDVTDADCRECAGGRLD